MKMIPWDGADPTRRYVSADKTDIRKTFKAARKRQLRALELQRRKAVKK